MDVYTSCLQVPPAGSEANRAQFYVLKEKHLQPLEAPECWQT